LAVSFDSQAVNLRYAALNTLKAVLLSSGKAVNEAQAKDLSKSLRALLSDKMAPLQRASAEVRTP
jgi:hypothetical protein